MKTKKLVRKIKALLSKDRRAQVAKYESLEKILKKIEAKEEAFRKKLDAEKDKDRRKEIRRKLEVLAAQREKGTQLRREIEAQSDDS
jgi:hypothetical protein